MSSLPLRPDRETILKDVLKLLKTKYKLTDKEITQYLREEIKRPEVAIPLTVPVTIINDTLAPLEAIVKYLKEAKQMKLVDIAKLTGRDQRAIGVTYRAAIKKMPAPYKVDRTKYNIPIELLKNKKYTVAEHIVKHLKETYNLNYHEIAVLMKRDDRTIWTLYNRAMKKNKQ